MREGFEVGDRVERPVNVHDRRWRLKYGVVVERYSDMKARFGPYPELYAVKWDGDGRESRGYFRHGLRASEIPQVIS
jgi:hypothetical protein